MVEVKNLKMSYGNKEVLKDISFKIEEGMTVGLLGENGAGKSTTMNILTGYLKPVDGEVWINKVDMQNEPKKAKKFIGYLPEIPPLYKDMKVSEYLMFVAELKGVKDKKDEVDNVLQLVDLEERRKDFIKKLSKGLQQRVGFAQALLGNPPVLIMDEPLVGLDPSEAKKIRELIIGLRENHVIIISSHILKEIEELCDSVLMLKNGSIIFNDSTTNAKQRGMKNIYRLTVKGKRNEIETCLNDYSRLKEVCFLSEKEADVFEFSVKTQGKTDIRDSIIGYLAGKQITVYGIEKMESTLEDIFIEMNSKEEK